MKSLKSETGLWKKRWMLWSLSANSRRMDVSRFASVLIFLPMQNPVHSSKLILHRKISLGYVNITENGEFSVQITFLYAK